MAPSGPAPVVLFRNKGKIKVTLRAKPQGLEQEEAGDGTSYGHVPKKWESQTSLGNMFFFDREIRSIRFSFRGYFYKTKEILNIERQLVYM